MRLWLGQEDRQGPMAGPCQELGLDAEVPWVKEPYRGRPCRLWRQRAGRLTRRTGQKQESVDQGAGLGEVGQPDLRHLVTVDGGRRGWG